jgi:hypothetical protein
MWILWNSTHSGGVWVGWVRDIVNPTFFSPTSTFCHGSWFHFADTFEKKNCPEIFFGGVSVTYFLLNILRSVVGQKTKDKIESNLNLLIVDVVCIYLFSLADDVRITEMILFCCQWTLQTSWSKVLKFKSDYFLLCLYNWGTLLIGKQKREG